MGKVKKRKKKSFIKFGSQLLQSEGTDLIFLCIYQLYHTQHVTDNQDCQLWVTALAGNAGR